MNADDRKLLTDIHGTLTRLQGMPRPGREDVPFLIAWDDASRGLLPLRMLGGSDDPAERQRRSRALARLHGAGFLVRVGEVRTTHVRLTPEGEAIVNGAAELHG